MLPKTVTRAALAAVLFLSQSAITAPNSDIQAAHKLLLLQQTSKSSAEQRKVVDSMMDFGLKVHGAHVHANKNLTTSPFSLSSAFGLVLNGAKNDTLVELTNALALEGLTPAQFNTGYSQLRASLKNISKDNKLSFGNAIFADTDFQVRAAYLKAVREGMGADARTVNFRKPAEAAADINGYIAKQTENLIQNMVNAAMVDGWRTALVNAGYYKGAWAFNFDVKATQEQANFDNGKENKLTVPMMHSYGKTYLYHRGDGFQMASLAYKNGDFAMDLIVPDQKDGQEVGVSLKKVEDQLTGANYRAWVAALSPRKVDVLALPRFETEYKQEMTEYFKAQMPLSFSNDAEFGLLSPEAIKLDKVIHATVLKVNEEGTEGAFATVIGGVRATSVQPTTRLIVRADHPFVMVIRHTASGTPIFVSTIWEPKPLARPAGAAR